MDSPHYIRSRIANACDGCKARKVKCDGKLPCGYCAGRRRPQTCHYSPQRRRKPRSTIATPASASASASPLSPAAPEDDTEVPREARLVCDAQGKLVFIGDCAPLSFFQSVRQVVTSRVGQHAFTPESSGFSALENVPRARRGAGKPDVRRVHVPTVVANYLCATSGLVDLFDETLEEGIQGWVEGQKGDDDDVASVVNHLVLAIGTLREDEAQSYEFFEHARAEAYGTLSNLGTGTVQAYILITVYMLCSCQINGAFLFFGMATRAAYSIGVHRSEVNARFGPAVGLARDKLWKSLRVVDLFLSISMGRPPSASDVDCSVPYRRLDAKGDEVMELLNASVQVLLITERIVVDVFSRKKISLQLTEGISHQLRDWSARWLAWLKDVIAGNDAAQVAGAAQVLASYYYAVMLVSRPFLMYELVRRLGDSPGQISGKGKLADACIDAASLMVDLAGGLIERGRLNHRLPVLV